MSGAQELDVIATRVGNISDHVGLLAMAAQGMISDGDAFNGRRIRAASWVIEALLADIAKELAELVNAWMAERRS